MSKNPNWSFFGLSLVTLPEISWSKSTTDCCPGAAGEKEVAGAGEAGTAGRGKNRAELPETGAGVGTKAGSRAGG